MHIYLSSLKKKRSIFLSKQIQVNFHDEKF